ncbi:DUF5304 domain-containing protein [Streptomyces litchfieldiae]|uniref:DUF5304 domain-containing protein n=1 Tax=Streptomyces litchfieldiae TaxID=3075543 RepID=A0ABU2MY29_9ACTN|nr:DUF5304 domain-containing protein [Streptomyces sp. DSM 44938]MDT0346562.1 DUF5304 domain-containing protein [Streptomyces sp. DSM 44938]
MSDVSENPAEEPAGPAPEADSDAWATACGEDLDEERARRRAKYHAPTGDAAEELRKLADALTDQLGRLGASLGPGVGLAAGPLAAQARAALEPVIERNAEVFQHLAGAGQELLAAYRAAVLGQEGRWTRGAAPRPERDTAARRDGDGDPEEPDDPDTAPGSERIDLD